MSDSIRAFLAIPLSPEAVEAVSRISGRLRSRLPEARFVPRHQLHLTLHFFEALSRDQVEAVQEAMRCAALSSRPFSIEFHGLGVFGDRKRPRVLWLGVREGALPCRDLHARLSEELSARGVAVEGRPFSPHLTLARFRTPPSGGLDAVLGSALGPIRDQASRIVLFESRLTPHGAEHTPRADHRLGESAGPT